MFVGAAVLGVILTPFTTALPAFFLLNAAAFVFFGRKEVPTKLRKEKPAKPDPEAEAGAESEPETVVAEPAAPETEVAAPAEPAAPPGQAEPAGA